MLQARNSIIVGKAGYVVEASLFVMWAWSGLILQQNHIILLHRVNGH